MDTARADVRDSGVVDEQNPWPGLTAFQERDAPFFHGREAAIEALCDLVSRERASILYGASGLGKTSLIQAGLFPRVRQNDLLPVRLRLSFAEGHAPFAEQVRSALLAEAADKHVEVPERSRPDETLWEYFYRKDAVWWSGRHRILTPLIVFDQFEEIFTIGRRTATMAQSTRAFLQESRGLILGFPPDAIKQRCDENPDEAMKFSLARVPLRVLFSFREDYLAEFLELRGLLPTIGENDFRLLRMSTHDALRVITKAGGQLVTTPVAEQIVEIIAAARSRVRAQETLAVDPALLSVFCRELNNERVHRGQAQITAEVLTDQQASILENFYRRSLDGLDRRVAAFIEDDLLLPDSAERNSVAEQVALRRPGVTPAVIDSLINRRLLRRDDRDGPPRLELAHDVLIEPVRHSRDIRVVREQEEKRTAELRENEAKERQRLAAARERDRQELTLTIAHAEAARATAAAASAEAKAQLANRELAFQGEKRRRLRVFLGVTIGLSIAALLLAWSAWSQRRRAEAALAAASLIRASSTYGDEGRNDIALAYLAYAARTDGDNRFARGRLADALLRRTWPLPLGSIRQSGSIVNARFTGDGKQLLVADDASGIGIWPADGSSNPERRLFTGAVVFAQLDPRGSHLLAVTPAGTMQVWDLTTAGTDSPQWTLPLKDEAVSAAAFNGDGTLVAIGTAKGTVQVWAPGTQTMQHQFHARDAAIISLQFDSHSARLLTGSQDNVAQLWDIATSTEQAQFLGHGLGVTSVQFSPDERRMLTTSAGTARIWDVPAAVAPTQPAMRLRRAAMRNPLVIRDAVIIPHGNVTGATFSPDGYVVLTGSTDGSAGIWDVVTGAKGGELMRHRGAIVSAAFNADGTRVVTASKDRSARVWGTTTGAPLSEPMWHDAVVNTAVFDADGSRVVTGGADGSVVVWDVRPGTSAPESLKLDDVAYNAQFSADDAVALITTSRDARVLDTRAGRLVATLPSAPGSLPSFSANGSAALTIEGPLVHIWNTSGWERRASFKHSDLVFTARFGADDRQVITTSVDGPVTVWDIAKGTQVTALRLPEDLHARLRYADLSADSRTIVAAGIAGTPEKSVVAVWTLAGSDPSRPLILQDRTPAASYATFRPGGNWLVTFGIEDTALVWDITSQGHGPTRLGHDAPVLSARFNPSGTQIVTSSVDRSAKIWTHPKGTAAPFVLHHDSDVIAAAFSPDGRRVATASRDATARVWDAASGEPASLPLVHPVSVWSADFSRGGQRLLTASDDGTVRIWDVPEGTNADAVPLARLAEAISGFHVTAEGTLERLDALAAVREERSHAARLPANAQTLSALLARWFFEDRATRTISPFSNTKRNNE